MKQYTKLFSALILSLVCILTFSSCLGNDEDSLPPFEESIVTVNKISDGVYDFILDNGKSLWIATPSGSKMEPKHDRAIIRYTVLSDTKQGYDYSIALNGFYDVLTKDIIYIAVDDQEKQDSIGHDPVKILSIWEGGGYLNVSFSYNVTDGIKHMINLVSDNSDLSANESIVKLSFRHNAKEDTHKQGYPVKGYVSFDLTPYRISSRDRVTIEITSKDYNDSCKKSTIEYEYDVATPIGG